jgi:hypothetical protein
MLHGEDYRLCLLCFFGLFVPAPPAAALLWALRMPRILPQGLLRLEIVNYSKKQKTSGKAPICINVVYSNKKPHLPQINQYS